MYLVRLPTPQTLDCDDGGDDVPLLKVVTSAGLKVRP